MFSTASLLDPYAFLGCANDVSMHLFRSLSAYTDAVELNTNVLTSFAINLSSIANVVATLFL